MILIINGTPKDEPAEQSQRAAAFYRAIVTHTSSFMGNENPATYWECRQSIEECITTLDQTMSSAIDLLTMKPPNCWRCANLPGMGGHPSQMIRDHREVITSNPASEYRNVLHRHRFDGWLCVECDFFIGVDDGRVVY